MKLDKARVTLERIEDIEARVRSLEDDGLDDSYGPPNVLADIKGDLLRLRHWAEAIVGAREQEALSQNKAIVNSDPKQ